jgi:hypothetical protein
MQYIHYYQQKQLLQVTLAGLLSFMQLRWAGRRIGPALFGLGLCGHESKRAVSQKYIEHSINIIAAVEFLFLLSMCFLLVFKILKFVSFRP